jgi:enoyl-CoA hydratase
VSAPIISEFAGEVTVLRMQHGRANALDLELLEAIRTCLEEHRKAAAVVLTGTGGIFSAGVDLFKVVDGGRPYLDRLLPALRETFERLMEFPRPLVAAVNGHAIAGGCILVETADQRVLANGAGRIGVTEILVGVPFPVVAIEILRFGAGARGFNRLVLRGETVDPAEALELGLVDELADPGAVLDRAVELARSLAAVPSRSFALVKSELRRPFREAVRIHAAEIDAEVDATWKSDPALEAIGAYVERLRARR